MRTTVSSRGQTAVPAELRRRLGLTEKSRLEWLVEGGVITILPVPPDPARAFRGSLQAKYSVQSLLRDRARERKRERARG